MREKNLATLDEFVGRALPGFSEWGDLDLNYETVAKIDASTCIGCNCCVVACHDGAHQCLHISKDPSSHVPIVDEDECVGCNLCEIVCPVPDCISMVEVDNGFEPATWNDHVADGAKLRPKKASHYVSKPEADVGTSSSRFAVLVFSIWLAVHIVLVWHHEPWRDEADAWLLARDVPVAQFRDTLGGAGTPAVWYLLQAPFARTGAPFATQKLLASLLACGAVWILLFRSPFSRALKVCLAFGYYLSFEYSVVARNYEASVLLLFCVAASHATRLRSPMRHGLLVTLLASTSVHAFLLSGVIFLRWAWDVLGGSENRARSLGGLALACAGLLAAVYQLRPADGPVVHLWLQWQNLLFTLQNGFTPSGDHAIVAVATLAALVCGLLGLSSNRRDLFTMTGMLAAVLGLHTIVYRSGLRHDGFLLLAYVFVLWTHLQDIGGVLGRDGWRARALQTSISLVTLMVAVSCLVAGWIWYSDVTGEFSGAQSMALQMEGAGLDQLPTAASGASQGSAVLANLDRRAFWYPEFEREGSYMPWGPEFWGREGSVQEHLSLALLHFAAEDQFLFLANSPLEAPAEVRMELALQSQVQPFSKRDEIYFLYRVRPGKDKGD